MNRIFVIKKSLTPLYAVLLFTLIVSIAGKIVLACLTSAKTYLYYNKIMNDDIQSFLLYIIIIFSGVLFYIICKDKRIKIFLAIVCVLSIVVLSSCSGGFGEATKTYFEFQSSGNGKIIVVEECSWLLGGWSNVYQKIDSHIVKQLNGRIGTDDGYRPFTLNDYKLEWSENSVLITYGFGNAGIQVYTSKIFQLE